MVRESGMLQGKTHEQGSSKQRLENTGFHTGSLEFKKDIYMLLKGLKLGGGRASNPMRAFLPENRTIQGSDLSCGLKPP